MSDAVTAAQLLQQGLFHHRQGDLKTAMERYVEVLQADPHNADALYYVAVVVCQDGQFQEGIKLARRALDVGPPQARVHNLLGQALYREGDRLEAIKNFDRAIALDPNFAEAHGNRANILADVGYTDQALASFDRALALNPNSATDWLNRGALLHDLGRYAEALASVDKAIACGGDAVEAHVNRGNALKDLGHLDAARGASAEPRFAQATAAYDKALALAPNFPEAHLNRGMVALLRGDWEAGFADYEYRSQAGEPTYVALPQPRWDGAALAGEGLVLVSEQGLGDTIQFCRFAPLLAARGFDVTMLTRRAMAPLLSTLNGVAVETDHDKLAQDERPLRWLPLLSVPGVLGVHPDSVPADVPYLAAEPERVAAWGARLGAGFKIGINWASGHSDKPQFKRRDLALADFAPLAALGVKLVALQKGPAAREIAMVPFAGRVVAPNADPAPDADFFLDTAAIMMNLDLIVTCDTSVAHLAGALARPVFTALPAVADWRWLMGRSDCPWYPTMRLFRQDDSQRWAPVMARMVEAVRQIPR